MSVLDIPVDDMIRLICEHALVTEYATNPIGNLALRKSRSHLLAISELSLGDLDDFVKNCPESIIPGIIKAVRNLGRDFIGECFSDLGADSCMKDRIICDYLDARYEENIIDDLIEDEAFFPTINARPL